MLIALAWQDHLVIVLYLAAMVVLGARLARRQTSEDEYFLAGRQMPWFVVGVSIIASLLSSLTYLSEPSEVWKSGVTHMSGKMLAIPFEMAFVWLFCIPFLMRFRLTTAYEYLDLRFGPAARLTGVALFMALVIFWMGFVVLVSSRVLADMTGMSLATVIATVGVVATLYTFLGGLRAVIWTDVIQVALLTGGAVVAIGYVAWYTQSGPAAWFAAIGSHPTSRIAPWSADPFERATILSVAIHMFVWHICTHTANQMTVQRYFSTRDLTAARRSFVTGSLLGVAINLLLMVLGLAIFYFYQQHPDLLSPEIDPASGRDTDRIFPLFVVEQLPPGIAGAILAALLAAAMSSIDSGVNSLATVLTVERHQFSRGRHHPAESASHQVRSARVMTLIVGLSITLAAYLLDELTRGRNIVEMMPKSFNCFTGALGGLFFIGIFMPRAGTRSAVAATFCGLAASISLAYSQELFGLERPISFTWVMPGSLLVTLVTAALFSRFTPPRDPKPGLTWVSRRQ